MLAKDLEADTRIFGEDRLNKSAMQMLEDIFLMTSPPLQRKLDLFRVGQNGRTFSTWSTELHNLADEAKLDTLTSEEILVLLYIIGADDGNLQDKFLTEYEPTLKTIEKIGFQHEITSNSKQAVRQSRIMAVPDTSNDCNTAISFKDMKDRGLCTKCGSNDHGPNQCRFRNSKCHNCNMIGHIAKVCQKDAKRYNTQRRSYKSSRNRANRTAHSQGETQSQQSEQDDSEEPMVRNTTSVVYNKCYSIFTKGGSSSETKDTPRVEVKVARKGRKAFNFKALPDTGTTRTIVALNVVKRHGIIPRWNPNERLLAANGKRMSCQGTTNLKLTHNGVRINANAIVSSSVKDEILISWHDLVKLGIIRQSFPSSTEEVGTPMHTLQKKTFNPRREMNMKISERFKKQRLKLQEPIQLHTKTHRFQTRRFSSGPKSSYQRMESTWYNQSQRH